MASEEKFWARVDRSGGPNVCWPWLRGLSTCGYGKVWWQGASRQAHRVAFELARGLIPGGALLLHSCDVPRCCNPAHLRPGTALDNARDAAERGRRRGPLPEATVHAMRAELRAGASLVDVAARHDVCPGRAQRVRAGVTRLAAADGGRIEATRAKLSPADVAKMRAELSAGARTKALAAKYLVHVSTVKKVRAGAIWRDVA
jgi:HNH endonuclease